MATASPAIIRWSYTLMHLDDAGPSSGRLLLPTRARLGILPKRRAGTRRADRHCSATGGTNMTGPADCSLAHRTILELALVAWHGMLSPLDYR
jgi:hypothetical protein